ncbi:Hypothetical_protein [Hexamita inflata]|uniref:Hypothetical_protein n=1 Tax=Hexamita inflata TaxID=28002 RepID=A0AA86PI70_9EUKA|nr:Hypothetical protein HINF_LOCUS23364 [Hexamita inflata]
MIVGQKTWLQTMLFVTLMIKQRMSNRVVNYFTESKKQSPSQIQFNNIYQIKFDKSQRSNIPYSQKTIYTNNSPVNLRKIPGLRQRMQFSNNFSKIFSKISARRRQPGGVTASRFWQTE